MKIDKLKKVLYDTNGFLKGGQMPSFGAATMMVIAQRIDEKIKDYCFRSRSIQKRYTYQATN